MAKILDLNASAPYLIRLPFSRLWSSNGRIFLSGGVCTMRLMAPSLIVASLMFSSLPFPAASAQTTPSPEGGRATPVRSVLGLVPLPTVVEAPRHFRLLRMTLPAGQSSSYTGAQGFIYVLSGGLTLG